MQTRLFDEQVSPQIGLSQAEVDRWLLSIGLLADQEMLDVAREVHTRPAAKSKRDGLYDWLKRRAEQAEYEAEKYRVKCRKLEEKIEELRGRT